MLRLNQLRENLESGIISYDNFVKIINNDNSITIKEFFELMNDSIAKQIITSAFMFSALLRSFLALVLISYFIYII